MISNEVAVPGFKSLVGKRRGEIDTAISLIEGGVKLYNQGMKMWHNHLAYSIVVSERDLLYAEVHNWLITTLNTKKNRAISVSSSRINEMVSDSDTSDAIKPKPLTIRFNETKSRLIKLNGHPIRISLNIPDEDSGGMYREPRPAKIEFISRTQEGQAIVLRLLEKLNSQRATTRKPVLKMVGRWAGWTTRSDLPPRTLASVSLPQEQKTRVVEDLKKFLEAEEAYNRLAIPWHRAYMFEGPPGTGKTSFCKALAHEFSLDLWYISLSDLKAESSLLQLLSEVGPRSILLLEDIDTIKITHDRDSAESGTISMGSLLNTLDGVATPHGLITMMTTNRFEILDPALTRAGRMDIIEKLDYPTLNTISDMYLHFYGKNDDFGGYGSLHKPIVGFSTSQVAEIMKRHMDDNKAASTAIRQALLNHAVKKTK